MGNLVDVSLRTRDGEEARNLHIACLSPFPFWRLE